jgi:sodium transport system permease protein
VSPPDERVVAPRGWRASALLLRKELREAGRDRTLLAQLVLVPLFLYPLLGMMGYQIYLVSQGVSEQKSTLVWVDEAVPETVLDQLAEQARWRVERAPSLASTSATLVRESMQKAETSPQAWLQWEALAGADSAIIYYDASKDRARRAKDAIRSTVRSYSDSLRTDRAAALGMNEEDLEVFVVTREEVSESSEFAGWILSLILPVVLLVMLPQGAYHATLDTIVGERERGTWETLLTSSLERGEIVLGKFGYVVTWSLAATLLNFAGMVVFLWAAASILGLQSKISVAMEWAPLIVGALAVVIFAVAVSAVMILVALPARSYREGQAALSPVYLVSAVGAMLSVTGSDAIDYGQAMVPVLNVAALLRTTLRGELPLGPALLALSTLLVLAVFCVGLASRALRDEDVYFESAPSLRALLRRRS